MIDEEAMNPQEPTGKRTTPTWTDIRRKLGQTDMKNAGHFPYF
jgi:hypothetical protein